MQWSFRFVSGFLVIASIVGMAFALYLEHVQGLVYFMVGRCCSTPCLVTEFAARSGAELWSRTKLSD